MQEIILGTLMLQALELGPEAKVGKYQGIPTYIGWSRKR
jgi:hypothetical protein